jgi:predicted dehydrogenase
MDDGRLLVIGGGRWARVYLSILARIPLPGRAITVVSQHGGDSLDQAVAAANAQGLNRCQRMLHLEDALNQGRFAGAIVTNAARDHVRTALSLLNRRIATLVEKPIALTEAGAAQLIDAARMASVAVVPALVLRHCDYLRSFVQVARSNLTSLRKVEISWSDPAEESRYGEAKGFDFGLGVAEEIAPHVATILMMVAGGSLQLLEQTSIQRGGLGIEFGGLWNGVAFSAILERQTPVRKRLITVSDELGRRVQLDFAVEPGTISTETQIYNADSQWNRHASPLTQQTSAFIKNLSGPFHQDDIEALLTTTTFTASVAGAARLLQRRFLSSSLDRPMEPSHVVAMRELLAPLLTDAGSLEPGDNEKLDSQARRALSLLAGTLPSKLAPELAALLRNAGLPGGGG